MILSGVLFFISNLVNMLLQNCSSECYTFLWPLIMLGMGYLLYPPCCFICIPYTVKPNIVGTAYGITISI